MGTTVNNTRQNKLQLIDYLEQTIHSLQYAVSLEQSISERDAPCEHFVTAIAALNTKLAEELNSLEDQ